MRILGACRVAWRTDALLSCREMIEVVSASSLLMPARKGETYPFIAICLSLGWGRFIQ